MPLPPPLNIEPPLVVETPPGATEVALIRTVNKFMRLKRRILHQTHLVKNHPQGWGCALLCFALLVWFLYWIRPLLIIRGPLILFYHHPVFLLTVTVSFTLASLLTAQVKKRTALKRSYFLVCLTTCLVTSLPTTSYFVNRWDLSSLYNHTYFNAMPLSALQGEIAPLTPHAIADNKLASEVSLYSENNHGDGPYSAGQVTVIEKNGHLLWTGIEQISARLPILHQELHRFYQLAAHKSTCLTLLMTF